MIRSEKNKSDNEKIFKIENGKSCSELWNYVKKKAGWSKSLSPKIIKYDGIHNSNPTVIANLLNNFYISKVNDIVRDLYIENGDPTWLLRKLWDKWRGKNDVQSI